MVQNVLITPTLLDSYEFAKNAPPSWKARAMEGFVSKIRREAPTMPEWVYKGNDFEDTVYRVCNKLAADGGTKTTKGSANFQKVVNACLGGSFQDVFKKTLEIDGLPVLFYNKTDVVFPSCIKDIKTTLKWKGQDKYLNGWQHKMYLWAADLQYFEYIVAVWENEHSNKLAHIHTIPYTLTNPESIEQKIVEGVKDLFGFLHDLGLYDDYFYTFSNNKGR